MSDGDRATTERAARVEERLVTEAGLELRDGTTAGVGDLIVTRRNQRRLTSRGGSTFVRNGDTWTVERTHGSLTVRNEQLAKGVVRLTRSYIESHVELGYATRAL